MTETTNKTARTPSALGPRQLAAYLEMPEWQLDRAVRLALVPPPDRARGRWSRTTAADITARRDEVAAAAGAVPDLGAVRAAEHLTEQLGMEVSPDAVSKLARQGLLRVVGEHKSHDIFDGQDLEALGDRETDVRHLHRAGRPPHPRAVGPLHPPATPRGTLCGPLPRRGAGRATRSATTSTGTDTVRATQPGRPSPLAALPDAP